MDGWYTSLQGFIVNANVNNSNQAIWGGHIFNNWGLQIQSKKIFVGLYAGYVLYTIKDIPNTSILNNLNWGLNVGLNLR